MVKIALFIIAALAIGFALGVAFCCPTIRYLRRRVKELRKGEAPVSIFQSVTKFLFVTAQVFAIIWVSASYGIAIYSTVVLFQPFPVVELSQQAIITIIGAMALKVMENIFEHNEGVVFGRRPKNEESLADTSETETEGKG